MSEQKLLKVSQVAQMLNVDKTTVYRWCRSDWLPIIRLPSGRLRVSSDDLARAMQEAALKRRVKKE